jgi:NO-binding membrane sensor protein with MHYT domain
VSIPHDPWLVALSVAIAVQGSFVGLSLAAELDGATGMRRRLLLAGSALTLATGIWSMHFVAMLAASFPSAIDYLVLPTLASFLICVIVVGLGVYAAHAPQPPNLRIGLGAVAMGLGISTMHYVGMRAVHLAGPTTQEARFVIASVLVSIAASAFALMALGSRPNRLRLFLGAVGLGLAISGMHYTAMAGMRLDPSCFDVSRFVEADPALSRNALALLATVIAFGVSAAFLLSLVPDAETSVPQFAVGPEALAPASGSAMPISAADVAAVTPQRDVRPSRPASPEPLASVRVEKDGRARFIPVGDIYAVRANAHYTIIHDGTQEYFCNQSISMLEAGLDRRQFMRVHRSSIVRLDRVSRLKRTGEAAVVELGDPVRCSIPIARGQVREVKARIEALSALRHPTFRATGQDS